MRVFITNLNGHASYSTAQICQKMVIDIAVSLGYRELAIYSYPVDTDTPVELDKRIDGILAGLRQGNIVIFQTPTWSTTFFDEKLINKLHAYSVKIITFIHDVITLIFLGNYYLIEKTIGYYNKAAVVIAPSQATIDSLRKNGLTVYQTIIQGMWDYPTSTPQLPAILKKEPHFSRAPSRFHFVKYWDFDVVLYIQKRIECFL